MLREMPKVKGRPRRKPVRKVPARNQLAEDNAKLVGWAVGRFFRRLEPSMCKAYPRDDAQEDAWVGFLRACELWEPARGKLSGYAWWWMRQEMQQGLRAASNMIRSPSQCLEPRVSCFLKDEWMESESPVDKGEDVVVVVCRSDALAALEAALLLIDGRQALVIRMRLAGDTWTEVAKKLRVSIPSCREIEQEGQGSLRRELEHIKELV